MPIVNRQTVIFHRSLVGNPAVQELYETLQLDFEPTSLIVRQVDFFRTTANIGGLHGIIAPFTNAKDGIIATFISNGTANTSDSYSSNPNSNYIINHPSMLFNGSVLFKVRKLADTLTASVAQGVITLTLEFIREVYPEPTASVSQMSQLIQTLTDMSRPTDIYPFDNIDETKSQPARVETPEPTGKIAELQALEESQEGGQDDKKIEVKTDDKTGDITIKTKPRPI